MTVFVFLSVDFLIFCNIGTGVEVFIRFSEREKSYKLPAQTAFTRKGKCDCSFTIFPLTKLSKYDIIFLRNTSAGSVPPQGGGHRGALSLCSAVASGAYFLKTAKAHKSAAIHNEQTASQAYFFLLIIRGSGVQIPPSTSIADRRCCGAEVAHRNESSLTISSAQFFDERRGHQYVKQKIS